ncbi:hypothetical protein EJ03DRAFT_324254 [Teratosphaeria nubilosa]|uniref:NEDD8-activating enzyme E1 regulatory subunit n=1 Tax=Teratosphaeria nubilosa TaxID=161662 RepID=A0A6G1LIL8_9PEZI|nr:hypothetical protein EJ03DRAFT_324254 [Teratosphaeria nubilosa]
MATSHPEKVPPPLQDIPTAKEKKYDRQLRLWGAQGQVALEETHILLINSGPGVTGVEALKNLVLPGIGQFSILDSAAVSEADLGVNFFLDDESLGKFRAEETVRLLKELNPGVEGHAITEPLETFIANDKALSPYSLLLVAAPIDPSVLAQIQQHAQTLQIPTFYIHSIGYFSTFSLQLPPAFPIVDTHPDPDSITDLRLLMPWPALSDFAKEKMQGFGTEAMSTHDKAHIPWIALLLHYLDIWKQQHNGKVPESFKEKREFRELVRAGDPNEENFDEAYAAVLKSINPSGKPSSKVQDILSAPEAQNLIADSPAFWVIAHAIAQFVQKHGDLPLPGAVPDMKAVSADYIRLQNIYKSKAREDAAEVLATVRQLEKDTGRSPKLSIDEKEVENFCKGAAHIHLVRGRPLQIVEPGRPVTFGDRAHDLLTAFRGQMLPGGQDESLFGLYIAFLAWDEYVATHSTSSSEKGGQGLKMPGSAPESYAEDTMKAMHIADKIVDSLIKEAGAFVEDPEYTEIISKADAYAREMVRAGGGELHNIASLSGGLIAQEVIKVITRQYIPVDNTCVFDGVASRSHVFRV